MCASRSWEGHLVLQTLQPELLIITSVCPDPSTEGGMGAWGQVRRDRLRTGPASLRRRQAVTEKAGTPHTVPSGSVQRTRGVMGTTVTRSMAEQSRVRRARARR